MPKRAEENEEIKEKNITKTPKKSTTKKTTTSKKVASTSKSVSTKKPVKTSKTTTSKKATSKSKKKKTASSTKKKAALKIEVNEYYDLPNKYNQTVVKVLAQTPKTLFIYWEISDEDIANYKEKYGENFFEVTKPVLIIHNDTLNYSFEVEINDFANSWYLHINDSKSDYRIELGRRPIQYNENLKKDYIYISSSNKIESPNDHILFNPAQKMVYFKNVKTNKETQKSFSSLSFIKNMGRIYNIYDLYKEIYKNDNNLDILSNPSS